MKAFNKWILFLPAICLLLTACRTTRQVAKNTESTINQVTESKVNYRDTIFYTPKSETSITIPVSDFKKCPETDFKTVLKTISEPKTYTQKNGNATATVKVLHDTLTVTAECDSIALAAKIKQEYYKDYLEKVKLNDQYVQEQTKTNWQMVIALVVIAFIAGFVTKTLIKISI